jgi:hypothetical protein
VAIQNRSDGEAGESPEPAKLPSAITPAGASRRRFATAGASGVLLTLVSQPGMATAICTTPSGSLSGGLKSQHGPAPVCEGLSPGYWKNHQEALQSLNVAPVVLYGSVFACGSARQDYALCPLYTMLEHQSFDEANLGMHLVATYLNIKSGKIGFLSLQGLRAIWNEWSSTGFYTPTAGVKWNAADIVIYLKGTMS